MKIIETLSKIQRELVAPKDKFSEYGSYSYRSCEGILEALKPLLAKYDAALTLSDHLEALNGSVYVGATATLWAGEEKIEVQGIARETPERKKFDSSQLTGAASSYARKYALNGLFAIDDTKDADTDEHKDGATTKKRPPVDEDKIGKPNKPKPKAKDTPKKEESAGTGELLRATFVIANSDERKSQFKSGKKKGEDYTKLGIQDEAGVWYALPYNSQSRAAVALECKEQGISVDIEYTEREWKGKTFRDIDTICPSDAETVPF